MKDYTKERVVGLIEVLAAIAATILIYGFIMKPILANVSPGALRYNWAILIITATVTYMTYAVLRDPGAWYRIITALFFGADYTNDES